MALARELRQQLLKRLPAESLVFGDHVVVDDHSGASRTRTDLLGAMTRLWRWIPC